MIKPSNFMLAAILGAALNCSTFSADVQADPFAPDPQSSLKQMLSISYKAGTDLPTGIQDPGIGIINGNFVYAGGLSSDLSSDNGFTKKAYCLNLQSPATSWTALPSLPVSRARQGLNSVTVNNRVYMWGGYSTETAKCYTDGYCLSQTPQGAWSWTALPPLPRRAYGSGMAVIGSKIYAFGGADYDEWGRYTNTLHDGTAPRLGARMLAIDTNNLSAGWQELAQCPGTPRFTAATAAVNGKIYVIGGNTGMDNSTGGEYTTVVDDWRYDPATNAWSRLQDMPVASSAYPAGQTVFDNRYMIMAGGAPLNTITNPDGSTRAGYGTATKHDPGYDYYSDVFVYDTLLGKFGTATMLPLNNCAPMTAVVGNHIYMVGSETDGAFVDGKPYGHLPTLFLTGTISVVPEPSALCLSIIAAVSLLWYGWAKRR
jgi:N-acetylneuraminic acid mutarotase